MKKAQKVIVGMSGGVDSSVAALLLIQQGYQVEGLFMKNWDEDDGSEYCTAKVDLADAQQVCDKLDIPLHRANFAADYWDKVFEYFLAEYRAGRTPNPDILCNREIKFKVFLDYAQILGADFIATGHYTRVANIDGQARLLKGLDNNKDQSYFLHAVSESAFAKSLFPVGELQKPEVRAIAQANGFVTSTKKDSTGICFIGERRFKDFLEQYLPAQPGEMRTPEGELMGTHQGLMFYTLGQRQGLGIGGVQNSNPEPWYTLGKNLDDNILIVGQGSDHPLLYTEHLAATDINWINGIPAQSFQCYAKTRYRQPDQLCTVTVVDNRHCEVNFDQPQRAVTPGQSVVFYSDDHCLGGGTIDSAWNGMQHNIASKTVSSPH
jgi:tRNA-specific 2-thiouridylase